MRVLRWTAAVVAILFVALVLFLFFGLNTLRGPISRAVGNATGRELIIQEIKPNWTWVHPSIRAEGVTFANPDWAKEKYLLKAQSVVVTLSAFPLVAGRVV